jgi:hypothetical protein
MKNAFFYAMAMVPIGLALGGCAATESRAFRAMTAAEHERAAQKGADPSGASADEHLQAADRLRGAEQAACAEVPDAERDQGPFTRRDRIVALDEVRDRRFPKWPPQLFGVALTLRATPGMTEEWLGRLIQCHVAHYAVVGVASSPEPSPLLVSGAVIRVSSTGLGFRVSITSSDIDVAREVLNAGRAVVGHVS